MYCRNCGKEVAEQALVCPACGVPPKSGKRFCQNCGQETDPNAEICTKCGVRLAIEPSKDIAKSRIAAGILGIVLGGLGIHRFYLGYIGIGIAQIAVTLVTCGIGALWGFIEGILILTGSIDKDAKGQPLRD
jgi:TM2 domain-containing membrane protein YozV